MTKEEFAKKLDGVEYAQETRNKDLIQQAKQSGLVMVYGASDDLVEFDGALYDECSAGDITDIFICRVNGSLMALTDSSHNCDCEYCGFEKMKDSAKKIKAEFDKDGYTWVISTEIPHATFEVIEDGEKFCRGIVFSLDDLK